MNVPGAPVFALEGALPNPAAGDFAIVFTLAGREPASIEVFDLAGRRVHAESVSALGPGRHTVSLAGERAWSAGLYFLHLTQGAQHATSKVCVIR